MGNGFYSRSAWDEETYYSEVQREQVFKDMASLSVPEAAKVSQSYKIQDLKKFYAKPKMNSNENWSNILEKCC